MKYVSIVFNALCWALSFGAVAYTNPSLRDAVNVGDLFWGCFALLVILSLTGKRVYGPWSKAKTVKVKR